MIKMTSLLAVILAFAACDEDYNTIGGEIIENPTNVELREFDVLAYSKKVGPVQTNNLANLTGSDGSDLSGQLLGVYDDPIYGSFTASILTQLSLTTINPDFGSEPVLDSVVLSVPYFSTEVPSEEGGESSYELDSIYGDAPFKISIYRSNYFLSDFDPDANFEERQRYYSNQQELFENNLAGDPIHEVASFLPSADPVVTYEMGQDDEIDTITSPPAMRIKLPVDFFRENIIEKEGSQQLLNNNNFRNFLRGLYFKAEPVNDEGNLILFNMTDEENAGITLYYTQDTNAAPATYKLNFGSNLVNTFENDFSSSILQEIENADEENGEERLFLKGGEGSMVVIKLFEDEAELEDLRQKDWLINEANLTFYVDQDWMSGINEPERVFLYDIENNRILEDYFFSERTVGDFDPNDPLNSMVSFSSRLERNENENGVSYTVNITQHISSLISNEDLENVKLGLVVTQNINDDSNSVIRGAEDEEVSRIPAMSVLSPKGTVLHGNQSQDEDKRLKLRIYFTEVNQ